MNPIHTLWWNFAPINYSGKNKFSIGVLLIGYNGLGQYSWTKEIKIYAYTVYGVIMMIGIS